MRVSAAIFALATTAGAYAAIVIPISKNITADQITPQSVGADIAAVTAKWSTRFGLSGNDNSFVPTNTPIINLANYAYLAPILIGTPPQYFNVQLDTGSSRLWVEGSSCTTCKGADKFDSASSSTFSSTGTPESLQYGSGSCSGTLDYDAVNFAGVISTSQIFNDISSVDSVFASQTAEGIDGILGLAYNSPAQSDTSQEGVVQTLKRTGVIDQAVFGFWLNGSPTDSVDSNTGGEFTLGGYDSNRFTGSITWLTLDPFLVGGTTPLYYYWSHALTAITINGQSTAITDGSLGILDTGTSWIVAPQSHLTNIVLPALPSQPTYNPAYGVYTVDCSVASQFPVIQLALQGNQFSLLPEQYILYFPGNNPPICVFAISAINGAPGWILGDVFLRNYYSIYDFDNSRSGLALAVGTTLPPQVPSPSPSTSSTTSSATSSSATSSATSSSSVSPSSSATSSSASSSATSSSATSSATSSSSVSPSSSATSSSASSSATSSSASSSATSSSASSSATSSSSVSPSSSATSSSSSSSASSSVSSSASSSVSSSASSSVSSSATSSSASASSVSPSSTASSSSGSPSSSATSSSVSPSSSASSSSVSSTSFVSTSSATSSASPSASSTALPYKCVPIGYM
ncbi:aspartic peptidase domain-containing protein [Polychytrium aggregatum]|uniref:aspartic peptidase domain-containing protein n=1 Tax=Polychytrium aggregatum TaxID=110093 RepID=UPI0022FEAC6E|nr:aspartic peptidase domain-containing protein [Polychytrium aggregatum]KAI9209076.1 aspartic peptidase domain-containing protein [Polychytrium aggregatum]